MVQHMGKEAMLNCVGGCHTSLVATLGRNRARYQLLVLHKKPVL